MAALRQAATRLVQRTVVGVEQRRPLTLLSPRLIHTQQNSRYMFSPKEHQYTMRRKSSRRKSSRTISLPTRRQIERLLGQICMCSRLSPHESSLDHMTLNGTISTNHMQTYSIYLAS